MTITLRDANYKEVASQQVETDEYVWQAPTSYCLRVE